MITRAHIRRQLRASGGITNVMPREGYFLGSIVRGAKKAVGKVADVAKQVVKSPIGKAAILGLGASYLGPKIMSGGLGNFFKTGLGKFGVQNLNLPGGADMGSTGSGLLGLLSKGKKAISGMSGTSKLLGGAGLLSYFMSKGASEEEAKELAQDVYRGKGIGFDQIRADLNKYRSGELSQSQMFDKNYRFLTPRNFVAKDGGSPNMKIAEIPKGLSYNDAVKTFTLSNGRKPKDVQEVIEFFKNRKLSAEGGRIGYGEGSNPIFNLIEKISPLFVDESGNYRSGLQKAKFALSKFISGKGYDLDTGAEWYNKLDEDTQKEILLEKIKYREMRPDNDEERREFTMSDGTIKKGARMYPKRITEMPVYDEADAGKFGYGAAMANGGIMDMPMGNMRRNQAGVMERDYRDKGGFVPVGVKEKADDVPAMLSKNEFVMTADAVRGAGDGNIKKGAQRMYDLMKRNEGKVA